MKTSLTLIAGLLGVSVLLGGATTAHAQDDTFVLQAGTVVTVEGETYEYLGSAVSPTTRVSSCASAFR